MRAKLLTDMALAKNTHSKIDIVDARFVKPNNEKDEPKRAKLRKENDEPMCVKSMTDNPDPKVAKLRTEIVAPQLTYSSTDSDEAKRLTP